MNKEGEDRPPRNGKGEGMAPTKDSQEGFSVRRRAFEKMVKGALETIPRELKEQLENVAFIVEDEPSDLPDEWEEEDQDLLGLYHGVSRKSRGFWYGNALPDRILIYQRPLERISANLQELEENIRQTVIHEVGHYFGFDEEELRELEEEIFRSGQDDKSKG
jgi:predicted Zn-dependent protease with MMP-like domain